MMIVKFIYRKQGGNVLSAISICNSFQKSAQIALDQLINLRNILIIGWKTCLLN